MSASTTTHSPTTHPADAISLAAAPPSRGWAVSGIVAGLALTVRYLAGGREELRAAILEASPAKAKAALQAHLDDAVDVLFGCQLGGGTDINRGLAYAAGLVRRPDDTLLVLVTDLFEGGREAVRRFLNAPTKDDIVFLRRCGLKPVVVHGGGPQISKMLDRLDIPSEFKGGYRVNNFEGGRRCVGVARNGTVVEGPVGVFIQCCVLCNNRLCVV